MVCENTRSPSPHPDGQRCLFPKGFAFLSGKRFSQSNGCCPGSSLLLRWVSQWRSRPPVSLRCGFPSWLALEHQAGCGGRCPLQPFQRGAWPGVLQALTPPHALFPLGGAGHRLEQWRSVGPGWLVSCLGRPLPTTPMAMKMGISWIVYTIVCAKRREGSVKKCHQLLATRLEAWMLHTICPHAREPSSTFLQGCGEPTGDRLGVWGRLYGFQHELAWEVLRGPGRLHRCKAFTCSSPRHPPERGTARAFDRGESRGTGRTALGTI